jgi:phosphatidylglycerophosphatase A
MNAKAARLVASGGGLGHAPQASGTLASLAALLLALPLFALWPPLLPLAALAASLLGFAALDGIEEVGSDPSWVVIDEIAGQFLALSPLAFWPSRGGALAWGLAFVLFRFFDILKPWPVRVFDRRHDDFGVMGDDLCAGALAALVLVLWFYWGEG